MQVVSSEEIEDRVGFPKNAYRAHELKQAEQKQHHDVNVKERAFIPKDLVMARNISAGPKWLPGIIVKCCGPLFYIVELRDGEKTCGASYKM